jgi:hypothetical protein
MMRTIVLVVLLGLAFPAAAAADVCVEVDEARDSLTPEDRVGARRLLERQLIASGRTIAADPAACTERWTVAHVALGGSLTVTLDGPAGSRTATAASVAELGVTYAAMLDALFAPPSATEVAPPVAEVPPPAPPPAPRAPVIRRRGAFLGRVGYGVRFVTSDLGEGVHGTTVGIAYRRATERFGFEVSALNLMVHREDRDNDVVWDSFVKLGAFAYVPNAPRPGTYVGVAFSYGDSKVRYRPPGQTYWNEYVECGPQAELALGTELLSSSVFQVDLGLNVLLPLYTVQVGTGTNAEYAWSPGLSAALAVGF